MDLPKRLQRTGWALACSTGLDTFHISSNLILLDQDSSEASVAGDPSALTIADCLPFAFYQLSGCWMSGNVAGFATGPLPKRIWDPSSEATCKPQKAHLDWQDPCPELQAPSLQLRNLSNSSDPRIQADITRRLHSSQPENTGACNQNQAEALQIGRPASLTPAPHLIHNLAIPNSKAKVAVRARSGCSAT